MQLVGDSARTQLEGVAEQIYIWLLVIRAGVVYPQRVHICLLELESVTMQEAQLGSVQAWLEQLPVYLSMAFELLQSEHLKSLREVPVPWMQFWLKINSWLIWMHWPLWVERK